MRGTATWSGTIAFGMVAIPVQLDAATEEHTVRLHEVHTADGSGVQHRRFCTAEGREIPYSEVERGVSLPYGRMLPLSDEGRSGSSSEAVVLLVRAEVEALMFTGRMEVAGTTSEARAWSRCWLIM